MVKNLTSKYYVISSNANQTIAPTMAKFIGQLEYYYIEAVKIEYEYYVKREKAKEEQRALREQMRQEAEERRILEQQRKQVEAEQLKYEKELARINEALSSAQDDAEISKLQTQIDKVQSQLDSVQDKKDEIIRLQNGKAGTVYVISNIGSFGDDVFKIGMTRRLEPMDRVKELGDASVPFPFDVHCFIFSEDAVALGYRQVLCANSFTSLAEQSLHRAGETALDYPIAEGRERVKGGEAACEALDASSVFCY